MDKEKALNQLANAWGINEIKEDEFTIAELENTLRTIGRSLGRSCIQKKLKGLVDVDMLAVRQVKNPVARGSCFAYKPAVGKTWEDLLQYFNV